MQRSQEQKRAVNGCRIAVAFIVLSISKVGKATNIEGGQNRPVFDALCKLTRLARSDLTIPEEPNLKNQDFKDIIKLNMSLAPKAWKQVFWKTGEKDAWQDDLPPKDRRGEDWEEYWLDWKDAIRSLYKADGTRTDDKTTFESLPDDVKNTIRPRMISLANAAAALAKSPATQAQLPSLQGKTLKEKLTEALTGDPTKAVEAADYNSIYGATSGGNRATACTTGSSGIRTNSLMGALSCVCAPENDGEANYVCTPAVAKADVWANAGPDTPTNTAKIAKLCGKIPGRQLKAAELKRAVEEIVALITIAGGAGYLGATKGGCTGAQGSGRCVKFTGYADNDGSIPAHTPWLSIPSSIANELAARETRILQAESTKAALKALAEQARKLDKEGEIAKIFKGHLQTGHGQAAPGKTVNMEISDGECNKLTSNNTCKPPCKWNENTTDINKKCSLDPVKTTEQQAAQTAGTGEGAATTASAVNCSKHTKKEDCEKENEGLAAGTKAKCGWIEDKCKDSSILVSKQFALSVVSAAFVALLF
uniref:Variant surface glycoprotein n=1 Tax=Trypanosoma brucei TaxID=5691 RepID=A0A1V0G0A0_9TRYP|nr:variant surface glycoprotein [Trypanosoma brucei]